MKDDAYETQPWAVHRALEKIHLPGGRWIEPCAATGKIIRAVNEVRNDVSWAAAEVREECLPNLMELGFDRSSIVDFLSLDPKRLKTFDVLFSNPPYSLAQEFIEQGLRVAHNVVVLLRLNFLGSESRADFLLKNIPDVYVLPNRPSFILAASCTSDSCEWKEFLPLDWDPPKACPICDSKIDITSSDATEYAWFHFVRDPLPEGRLVMLNKTPAAVRSRKA